MLGDLLGLRANLPAAFFAAAFVVLATAYLVGVVGRGPLVAAGLGLALSLLSSALGVGARLARRLLWRIRRKLVLSYIFIAFVPLLLATLVLLFAGYAIFGQLLSYLSWLHVEELSRQVDGLSFQIANRLGDELVQASDLADARGRLERLAGLDDELRSLRDRYGSLQASAVVFDANQEPYVPPGLEWPAGVKAEAPAWLVKRRFDASFVLGREGMLEVRSAYERVEGSFRAYVEVWLPFDASTLEAMKRYVGMDLRIIEHASLGGRLRSLSETTRREPRAAGTLGAWPVFGICFISPQRWDSGERVEEGRLLVAERSLAGLLRNLYEFRPENRELILSVLVLVALSFVVIEGASLALGVSLARGITGSIHDISEGTQRIEQGDLDQPIPVTSNDQLGALSHSFNRMAESVRRLVRESAERERLEEELRIGRRIQQSLLPRRGFHGERFELAAVSFPAKEVGGDYYDYFELEQGSLALLVADVSGKGTEAAFYMAELKGIMLALTRRDPRPRQVLAEANALLSQSLDKRTFITMTYGVLNLTSAEFVFGRAGHNPLLYLPRDSSEVASLKPSGIALGIQRTDAYVRTLEEQRLELASGDILLFYTDGITDALGPGGELYGEPRLARSLVAARSRAAADIRDALIAEQRRFSVQGLPRDDLTLIVLKVR